jgi:hypothetical protein
MFLKRLAFIGSLPVYCREEANNYLRIAFPEKPAKPCRDFLMPPQYWPAGNKNPGP